MIRIGHVNPLPPDWQVTKWWTADRDGETRLETGPASGSS